MLRFVRRSASFFGLVLLPCGGGSTNLPAGFSSLQEHEERHYLLAKNPRF